MKAAVEQKVEELVEKIKLNKSNKFSKADFQLLVYAIISDKEFKSKKFFIKANEIVEEEECIADAMDKFMDKFLKHVGINNEEERKSIISTFQYTAKDIEFMSDLIEEAMYQYIEAGKGMRVFKDKKLQLTLKKITRSGKYDGQQTYKKTVVDKEAKLIRLKAKEAQTAK